MRVLYLMLVLLVAAGSQAQTFTESVIYSFCSKANCADGQYPQVGLIQGADGNFYGTASEGGEIKACTEGSLHGCGTLFKATPAGLLTILHAFCSSGYPNCPDGVGTGYLIQGSDGNIYGTTGSGGGGSGCGSEGCGTLFKVTSSGAFKTMYTFCSRTNCTDGVGPSGSLVQGTDGNFYGVTVGNGAGGQGSGGGCPTGTSCGTVFKITPAGALTTLYAFCSKSACADGGNPRGGLIQATDGNFYGTTDLAGAYGYGTLFKITPTGNLTSLYSFCSQGTFANCGDGAEPVAALLQNPDGGFYGTTSTGGGADDGTIYSASGLTGQLDTFITFDGTGYPELDGDDPESGLIFGSDGKMYGTTPYGGNDYSNQDSGNGEIYQWTGSDELSLLYSFCVETTDGPCPDGANPTGPLVQGSDGNLYGTAGGGDADGDGIIFKLSPSPSLPAPVQLSLSSSQVLPGKPVTATLKVLNAFSLTLQQCYAFQNGAPLGKVLGTYNSKTNLYTFSGSITPTKAGIYNYAVTCGGVESGFASLTVGDTTQTTLTASPNPVTPPAIVTLTATVTRTTGTGVPTGPVKFSVGTTVLGNVNLNGSGVATFAASSKGIAAGTYPVVATYSGDASDISSTSAAITVKVQQ
jgi:uncharacterized repeat protein (TIGR03803 family)